MTTTSSRAREPIAGPNPAGDDLTYDATFENIGREIARLEAVDGTRPNWQMVETEADRLLADRTKDQRLVVWSGAAKINLRGWEGLADAIGLYLDVLTFWDVMFPPARRLKARANLHEWFVQHALAVLEEKPVAVKDEGALVATQATLEEVDTTLSNKLLDLHPGSTRLRNLLQRKLIDLATQDAAPPPLAAPAPIVDDAPPPSIRDPEPAHPVDENGAEDPERSPEPADDEPPVEEEIVIEESPVSRRAERRVASYDPSADPTGTLDGALDALLQTAQLLRDRDPASPEAWRIRRAVVSLRYDRAPSTLEGPDASLREQLMTSFAHGDYRAVIEAGEDAILDRPAWLDAHRLVAESLGRSGAGWAGARQVALEETLALVTRSPTLVHRRFVDDSAVADPATREWLEASRQRAVGASLIVTAEDQEHERRVSQVYALANEGRIPDAVMLATALANRAADARGRFRSLLLAGTLAMNASRPLIARPILESLLELAERHQLEAWEPGLCTSLYAALLSCLRVLRDPSSSEDARERDLFDRMCRLDPAAAMRLG